MEVVVRGLAAIVLLSAVNAVGKLTPDSRNTKFIGITRNIKNKDIQKRKSLKIYALVGNIKMIW